jgi:hypothetical protein
MADKTYYATKTFRWDGENIPVGGAVKLDEMAAVWMLSRGAVTETKPYKPAKAKKYK